VSVVRPVRVVGVVSAATALLLGAACGGDSTSEPQPPTLDGSWSGTVLETGQTYSMALTQSSGRVSGSGTVLDVDGLAVTAVTGSVQGFNVLLEISYPNTNFNTVSFQGSFSTRDEMRGGLKFTRRPLPDSITFRRQ
jgi:hypothetical protein